MSDCCVKVWRHFGSYVHTYNEIVATSIWFYLHPYCTHADGDYIRIWKLILKIWIQNKYTFISIPKYDVSLNFDMKCYFLNFWFVNIWWVSNTMLFVLVNWHEHIMYTEIYIALSADDRYQFSDIAKILSQHGLTESFAISLWG